MKHTLTSFAVLVAAHAAGCMPADFNDAVEYQIQHDGATDAKSQAVEGMPFLRVDDYLLDRMAAVEKLPANEVRPHLTECVERSHALALETAGLELDRLSDGAVDEIWREFFRERGAYADRRAEVRQHYVNSLNLRFNTFMQELAADSTEQLREKARVVRAAARSSVREHHGSEAMMQMFRASHPTKPVPEKFDAPRVNIYALGNIVKEPIRSDFDDGRKLELLERFAPRILQQMPERTRYASSCDMIGTVKLHGSRRHVEVAVETAEPSVYAYVRKAVVQNREHPQLVYCYWYPEHPPARRGDPEAGPIDGATVRITLDSTLRPAIIEAVQNCGCHYRCFAARDMDDAAAREFGAPAAKGLSALTRPGSGGIEIIAEDLFDRPDGAGRPPIVLVPAAAHVPVGVTFDDSIVAGRTVLGTHRYSLHPYEILENMPTEFGRASMFGADGLVHDAGRTEGWLLAGTGMLSAGQPRQRGTQLICWDKHAFDDPHLLETSLRLPSGF